MFVRAHRQLRSRSRRWLVYPLLLVLSLDSIGGGYETVQESIDATAYPMPGQLIDVGGHRLHLNCTGSGSPTVVLEPGHGEVSSAMGWIAPAVAQDTRVCVYDRAGRGWSDPADGPQDAAQTAADLHTLLDRGHIPGPYVLAGHSFGGLYVLTFAATYPDQVAGLVLLDSTAPVPGPVPATKAGSYDLVGRISALLPAVAHLGAAHLIGDSYDSLPAPGTKRAPLSQPPTLSEATSTNSLWDRGRRAKLHHLSTLPVSRSSSSRPAANMTPLGWRRRTSWPPCRPTAATMLSPRPRTPRLCSTKPMPPQPARQYAMSSRRCGPPDHLPSDEEPPGAAAGGWRPPFHGRYTRGSPFGHRFHPIYKEWRLHTGQGLASVPGAGPVVAASAGTVVTVGIRGAYGNMVRLPTRAASPLVMATWPALIEGSDLGRGYVSANGSGSKAPPVPAPDCTCTSKSRSTASPSTRCP
jgi:pimeloyl-ACP methyl ester carboxylesterase